jgi:glucose dehydrogenase
MASCHFLTSLCCHCYAPAGGIVVFDLRTRVIKWQQHLDLTTATTKFTAHMFSSPTLADIDADGQMEVVVGTSVGFVYVLNSRVSSAITCIA